MRTRAGKQGEARSSGSQTPTGDNDSTVADAAPAMDSVTQSILQQRARLGAPLQVYLLLTLMAFVFALSSLFMPSSTVSAFLPRAVGGRFKANAPSSPPSASAIHAAAAKAAAAQVAAIAAAAPELHAPISNVSTTPVSPEEAARLAALKDDKDLPLVWLDVTIKGQPVGRIHCVLFVKDAPRAAENFRQLITGEKGVVPKGQQGAGQPYSFKGKPFYRIITNYIDQSGANTDSVFGGYFKDDPGGLALKHDRKGLLSMANTGADENTSHFSFMLAPAPHLDGKYTVFGEAVDGHGVIDAVNALAKNKLDHTATTEDGAVISDCGQIRKGNHQPNLEL